MNITVSYCDDVYSGRLLWKFRTGVLPLFFTVLTYKLKLQAAVYSETLLAFYHTAGRLISSFKHRFVVFPYEKWDRISESSCQNVCTCLTFYMALYLRRLSSCLRYTVWNIPSKSRALREILQHLNTSGILYVLKVMHMWKSCLSICDSIGRHPWNLEYQRSP